MKTEIIERLGQAELLLPALIAEGLCANDRVKARLSVLQAAGRRARSPAKVRFDLAPECREAGLEVAPMEALVGLAGLLPEDRMTAPGLGELQAAIFQDVATMIRAVATADAGEGEAASRRLDAIRAANAPAGPDVVELRQIARLTGLSGRADHRDSLHRLIMDMHKALNRLQAANAEEVLAGAHAYGLHPQHRPAVEAFMRGLESTRMLKFDHPGLGTTATGSGDRLVIQNDIGETDAHVVVVSVDAEAVTVTYSDVHLARAKFFTALFGDFPVEWSGLDRQDADGLGEDPVFYLVTGRCPAADAPQRHAFLEALGAALVFQIDWNKARKVLRNWVSKRDAVQILDWAARHRVGHRAFLELGGSDLVAAAVHHATPARIGFGERLDEALGRGPAVDFLKTVLRVSTEALLDGGSVRLARDRIEADLVRRLQRVDGTLLAVVVRQAGLAREVAADIAHAIAERQASRPFDRQALALRARRIEEKADRIAVEARGEITRLNAGDSIERLVDRAEEAIDELEQAAFIASLVPECFAPALLAPLAQLCGLAIGGAEAAASGVMAAAEIPEGRRVDADDSLAAVGRLVEAEHAADAAERAVTTLVLGGEFDLRTALSALELARALERATDRLAGFGHVLRAHVLSDLSR